MNSANSSVNFQPIFMKFYTHYLPFMSRLLWKYRCRFIVWYQVWRFIIQLYILHCGNWPCSFMCHFNSTESIPSHSHFGALNLSQQAQNGISTWNPRRRCGFHMEILFCVCWYCTHCHHYPTRYSFSTESSKAFEGEVPCPRTQHQNNITRLRGEKHDFSFKVLHLAGFKTKRQAATSAKHHALTIAPYPSLKKCEVF